MTWEQFVDAYSAEHLSGLSRSTARRAMYPLDALKRMERPETVSEVSTEMLSSAASKWRSSGVSETTIKSNLAHIRAALNWAKSRGWCGSVEIPVVKRAKRSSGATPNKGRPITPREFGLMLRSTATVVDNPRPWRIFLIGLWLSGLRLEEAILLTWDEGSAIFVSSDGSDRMYLRVHAENEKGASDRLHPITPDFERFLRRLPRSRGERVFPIPKQRGSGVCTDKHFISRVICRIGKAAGVVVNQRTGKTVSAHDLRRSFGERWAMAPGVTPQILMTLMRHESIETTLRYYAMMNAKTVSDVLRNSGSNNSGNKNSGIAVADFSKRLWME